MKFTINRATWLHAEPGDSFMLRSSDKKMCCLGFLGRSVGHSEKTLSDVHLPVSLLSPLFPEGLINYTAPGGKESSERCRTIARINDSTSYHHAELEERLTEEFASMGVEVKFIGYCKKHEYNGG